MRSVSNSVFAAFFTLLTVLSVVLVGCYEYTYPETSDSETAIQCCEEDGLACTDEVCEAGQCEHRLQSGYCLIEGACVESKTTNPKNSCQNCEPAVDSGSWNNLPEGAGCGDDLVKAACDGAGECLVSPDARGYKPRACGFDMDRDGVFGEAADDCDVCDGVTLDPDGDGVAEDLIYVDCDAGSNGDGSPTSPYNTLAAGFAAADGAGEEDIICFKGTCSVTATLSPTGGKVGTYTVQKTGNQQLDWEYPNHPFMLVGWDADNDGDYPPHDSDDTAIVDGSTWTTGDIQAFSAPFLANFTEWGHFTVRRFAVGSSQLSVTLFDAHEQGNSHHYWHDVEIEEFLKDTPGEDWDRRVFSLDGGQKHFSAHNVKCAECGGYLVFGRESGSGGPVRIENISYSAHGLDGDKVTAINMLGHYTGIEILNGVWDQNEDDWAYSTTNPGGPTAFRLGDCVQDVWVVNNELRDWSRLWAGRAGSGTCQPPFRKTENIHIDRNLFESNALVDYGSSFVGLWESSVNDSHFEGISITNNMVVLYDNGELGSFVEVGSGLTNKFSDYDSDEPTLVVANNTVDLNGAAVTSSLIRIDGRDEADSDSSYAADYIVIENNIFEGQTSGKPFISVDYAPSNFRADGNVYDDTPVGVSWVWDGTTYTTLQDWQAACACDGSARMCETQFVDRVNRDLHLAPGDTCAKDHGVDGSSYTNVDYDGDSRPRSDTDTWDVGADEF